MHNLAIRSCTGRPTSPPFLTPRFKTFKIKFSTLPGSNPGPAEPQGGMLLSEPARRTNDKCMSIYNLQKVNRLYYEF